MDKLKRPIYQASWVKVKGGTQYMSMIKGSFYLHIHLHTYIIAQAEAVSQ